MTTPEQRAQQAKEALGEAQLEHGIFCTVMLKKLIEENSAPYDFVALQVQKNEEKIAARREALREALRDARAAKEARR